MRKYDEIAELTKKHLDGKLEKLTMEYLSNHTLDISVQYEDDHDIQFNYDLKIDTDERSSKFFGHNSTGVLYRTTLKDVPSFDTEICDFLCNKLQVGHN